MIRIRRKKRAAEHAPEEAEPKPRPEIEPDAAFVGAYPGKPWERLTDIRHGRGSTIKILNDDEQAEVIALAKKYFSFTGDDFPNARIVIQRHLDNPRSIESDEFFSRAIFTEKRLIIRAYLSDADGRFIPHESVLPLLKRCAEAGLDFEVGAIDHIIEGKQKTEMVVGDGTEVISDKGYWFSHTHPAKAGVTNNVLPSTADLDVIIATARSYAHNLDRFETTYYILRDIGGTKITVSTSKAGKPASAKIERFIMEYYMDVEKDPTIDTHIAKLTSHLRMRHRLSRDQIKVIKGVSFSHFHSDDLVQGSPGPRQSKGSGKDGV